MEKVDKLPPDPPPLYPAENIEPVAVSEDARYKHSYNIHFSEESIRKGNCLMLLAFFLFG